LRMGLISTDQSWCPSQTCLLTPNLHRTLPRMLPPLNCVMLAAWCADIMYQCLCWCSEHFALLHWTERPYVTSHFSWQLVPVLWQIKGNRWKCIVQFPDWW
jgi:hypothetical protein